MIFQSIIKLIKNKLKPKETIMAHKYDIIVHDEDPNVKPEKVSGVVAESPKALAAIYKMTGQNIEILREYEDEESKNYGKPKNMEAPKDFVFCNGGGMTAATGFMKVDPNLPQYNPVKNPEPQQVAKTAIESTKANIWERPKEPPRFFDIGGIKCKMENGKMYQKQWMKLSEGEAQEFRLVSDVNNKICPIKGKHIEVMKWVLVQDEAGFELTEDEATKKLELING